MTPLDLKTQEEWEHVLDRTAREANMTACLTDAGGSLLFCRYDRYPLCAAIRDNPDAITFICSQTNTAMLAVVKKTRAPEVDLCEAGLLRIVVPIFRNNSVIGQVTACGLASEDEELDSFLVAKQLGISEERVLELAQHTPSGSSERLRRLGALLFAELNPKEP